MAFEKDAAFIIKLKGRDAGLILNLIPHSTDKDRDPVREDVDYSRLEQMLRRLTKNPESHFSDSEISVNKKQVEFLDALRREQDELNSMQLLIEGGGGWGVEELAPVWSQVAAALARRN